MFTMERDNTIDATIGNLVIADVLLPPEVAKYMAYLGILNDDNLAKQLIASKHILDDHYRQIVESGQN